MRSIALAAAVVAGAVSLWVFRSYELDDAFITYRIAENLAHGRGFVYNEGERIAVGTTPLWTIVLALAGMAGLSVPRAGQVLSVALLGSAAYLAALLGKPSRPVLHAVTIVLFVVPSFFLLSTSGMESSLYLSLACAALLLFERRRPVPAGVACGLLAITRTDGILLAAILAAVALRKRDRPLVAAFAPFALIALAWYGFAWAYFGSPAPVTLAAKIAQRRSGLWGEGPIFLRGALRWLGAIGAESRLLLYVPVVRRWAIGRYLPFFGVVPLLAAWGLVRGPRSLRLLALHAGLVTAAYGALNVPDYHWYYAPLVFALLVLAAAGIASLPSSGTALLLAVLLAIAGFAPLAARAGKSYPAVAAYRAAASAVKELGPGKTLSAAEIGIVGEASGAPMRDWLGLACPGAAPLLASRRLDLFLDAWTPDLLLVHEPLWPQEAALFGSAGARRYGFLRAIQHEGVTLCLLRRGDVPVPGGVVAIPGAIGLADGATEALALPPFDPRAYDVARIEATSRGPAALRLSFRTEVVQDDRQPYRVDIAVAGPRRAYEVPIARDWRFVTTGKVTRMTLEALGSPVTVHGFALGSGS
ncbi:MAG: hypothetical protein U0166_29285 [Acidobacteriota bacterium]